MVNWLDVPRETYNRSMDPMDQLWENYPALRPLDRRGRRLLEAYEAWLREEAIAGGGLGPSERSQITERHVLDSLLFAVAAADVASEAPPEVLDIGAGVGLPAIPLAIVWPDTRVVALDRAGRRVGLCRRAIRVLGLENIEVVQDDVSAFDRRFPLVTSRASLPPPALRSHLERLTSSDGIAIVAGSTQHATEFDGYETREYALKELGITRWMLIMRPSKRIETERL